MNEEIEHLIAETAKVTAERTVENIKRDLMREVDPKSIYVRTEVLLYNYPGLLQQIREKTEELTYFQKYGMPQKSKSITFFRANSGAVSTKSEYEMYEDQLESHRYKIEELNDRAAIIDGALSSIKADRYYPVIEMRYFQKKTISEISDSLSCTESVVRKNKNRLLEKLQWALFKDDIMEGMLKWLDG